ncbi:MAG: phage antirepressor protein, partial [Lactococcus garvieae]
LTNIITKGWSGMTTKQYKEFKGLKKENLRDNMSSVELALNILAEATTTEISKSKNPKGVQESKSVAREGGAVALNARKDIEDRTGQPAVIPDNAKDLKRLND